MVILLPHYIVILFINFPIDTLVKSTDVDLQGAEGFSLTTGHSQTWQQLDKHQAHLGDGWGWGAVYIYVARPRVPSVSLLSWV